MKRISIVALMLSLFASSVRAGKMDIDYLKPSPTKALAYSLIIPGGGYLHLSGQDPYKGYMQKGILYLALTVGAYAFTADQFRKGESASALMGLTCLITMRVYEFGEVTDDAERDRFAAYKDLVKDPVTP